MTIISQSNLSTKRNYQQTAEQVHTLGQTNPVEATHYANNYIRRKSFAGKSRWKQAPWMVFAQGDFSRTAKQIRDGIAAEQTQHRIDALNARKAVTATVIAAAPVAAPVAVADPLVSAIAKIAEQQALQAELMSAILASLTK